MAAKLQRKESGTRGARRLARRAIGEALKALGRRPLTDQAVHDARKSLKRARAMLRLLRNALGEETYRRENGALRDAARPLSEIRDSKVLLETLDALSRGKRGAAELPPTGGLRRALVRRREALKRSHLTGRKPLRVERAALRAAHHRAGHWRAGERGWSVLGKGLARVYRQCRRALATAQAERTPESLHEWRKRTKYLWHILQALEPLRPTTVGDLADQAHRLADDLGDHHDLTMLAGTLAELANSADRTAVRGLLPAIDRRRGELEQRAFRLGIRLYRESPEALEQRFAGYWRTWRRRARPR